MKLALGTVQFGIDYGINNIRGKIPKHEVFEILNEAQRQGIEMLDTGHAYGDSENIIGEYFKTNKANFKIVSKLPECPYNQTEYFLQESLRKLRQDVLYGYLFHNFHSFSENPKKLDILINLKYEGRIKKIGFSLYYPYELTYLIKEKINFDIVQIPFNLFDHRFCSFFQILRDMGIEIHVRSVFLQGLFFKNPQQLNDNFIKIKHKLIALNNLSMETNIPLEAISLNFVITNDFVDKAIIGIDSIKNLMDNIQALRHLDTVQSFYDKLLQFKEDDEYIIVPVNWK